MSKPDRISEYFTDELLKDPKNHCRDSVVFVWSPVRTGPLGEGPEEQRCWLWRSCCCGVSIYRRLDGFMESAYTVRNWKKLSFGSRWGWELRRRIREHCGMPEERLPDFTNRRDGDV